MISLNNEHGGDIYRLSEKERNAVTDFSANINPLGLSPEGKKALLQGFDSAAVNYPDPLCRGMIRALSDMYGVEEENIIAGNGATELIYLLMRLLKPSCVYLTGPSFSEYRAAAESEHIEIRWIRLLPEKEFLPEARDFSLPLKKGSVVFLGNPNNPDGRSLPRDVFLSLADSAAKNGGHLILDESFADFMDGKCSLRRYIQNRPEVIIFSSLTKFYAVPGLRIGCCMAEKQVISGLRHSMYPWNVNSLVQLYMTAALKDRTYQRDTVEFCRRERKRFSEELAAIPGIRVFPGEVNFILCRIEKADLTAAGLQEKLSGHHVLIRDCSNYYGLDGSYFRLAVRTKKENDMLLNVLKGIPELI